jgi:programmed cell death 6-interacting protein
MTRPFLSGTVTGTVTRYGALATEANAKKRIQRGGVAEAVLRDTKVHSLSAPYSSCLASRVSHCLTLCRKTSSVLRDNVLIYHQDIPAPPGISVIQEVYMVQSIVPPGLQDPRSIIGSESIIFGEMLGWGAREVISGLSDCVMAAPSNQLI